MASAASTAVQNVTLNYTAVSQCSHSPLSIFALVVGLLGLLPVIFSALHYTAMFLLFVCLLSLCWIVVFVCLFLCVCVSFFFFFCPRHWDFCHPPLRYRFFLCEW